jgi:putative DNA primase/helicase
MSENSAFELSSQLQLPAFAASDDRQYGSYAAGILRNAARYVALAPSIDAKLIAFGEVAATLSKAVSDLWLPKNIVVHRLNQIADAHRSFGLGEVTIKSKELYLKR